MEMRKILVASIFSIVSLVVFSQQDAQFSHNMFNHMGVNPGYAGIDGMICASAIARTQWMGFEDSEGNKGSPRTMLFSLTTPVKLLRGGVGLSILKDKLGFEDNIALKFGYSYHLYGLGPGVLGIGLQVGFLNKSIDFSKFRYIDDNDPLLSSSNVEKDMITDMMFGLFYDVPNKFYAGISTTQLIESKFDVGNSLATPTLARHYYLEAGYQYTLNNPDFELLPSTLIKSDFASTQFDINCLMRYKSMAYAGLSYRNQDAIVILLGYYPMKGLVGGIAYDITTSALGSNGRSSGTFEAMVKYCFKIERPYIPTSHHTVRFL